MHEDLAKYKGVHPGKIVRRELKKRKLKQIDVARDVDEFPQTFNQILSAKRRLNVPLALKLDEIFGWTEGSLAILQTHYDIAQVKAKQLPKPNLAHFRKSLFWDTDLEQIDWQKRASSVIERVMERGNTKEKREIRRFYGDQRVNDLLGG